MKLAKQILTIYLVITGILFNAQLIQLMLNPQKEQVVNLTEEETKAIDTLDKLSQAAKKVKEEHAKATNKADIGLAQFNQLKNGMSYAQATEILGSEGELSYSSDLGSKKTASYEYKIKGKPFASVSLIFRDDELISKTQYGLD